MRRTNLARVAEAPSPAVSISPLRRTAPVASPRVQRKRRTNRALATILLILVGVNVAGAPYYRLSIAERVRNPLHPWLRPSGYIGQTAGLLALAIFIFLWLYPLRKKYRGLAFLGSVGKWLDVHVTLALAMPLLLAIHAAWRFDGVIGLGYFAILIVCASGVIGRYLYTRIPRTRSGVELSLEEVAARRRALVLEIAATTGLSAEVVERSLDPESDRRIGGNPARLFVRLMTNDLRRWRKTRAIRTRWRSLLADRRELDPRTLNDVVRLAGQEISLAQQSEMLGATHRLFRYWHVAHRPVAISALAAVLIHVAIVVALGATWLW